METRYQGGLLVAEQGMDERAVGAELKALDDRLFLDKELDVNTGSIFYTVKYWRGDQPPDLVLDWRDDNDRPRALSSGVANEVRRMMAAGTAEEKVKRVHDRQAELNERKQQQARDDYQAIADDWKRYDQHRSGVLPRGAWLRMSRDKMRARGRKV